MIKLQFYRLHFADLYHDIYYEQSDFESFNLKLWTPKICDA